MAHVIQSSGVQVGLFPLAIAVTTMGSGIF